jgi:hypothetical protein
MQATVKPITTRTAPREAYYQSHGTWKYYYWEQRWTLNGETVTTHLDWLKKLHDNYEPTETQLESKYRAES